MIVFVNKAARSTLARVVARKIEIESCLSKLLDQHLPVLLRKIERS
jgi:hypothetical protein